MLGLHLHPDAKTMADCEHQGFLKILDITSQAGLLKRYVAYFNSPPSECALRVLLSTLL